METWSECMGAPYRGSQEVVLVVEESRVRSMEVGLAKSMGEKLVKEPSLSMVKGNLMIAMDMI